MALPAFERSIVQTLTSRLREKRQYIQIIEGPRQTGKSTAIAQSLEKLPCPIHSAQASQGLASSQAWLRQQWEEGRRLAHSGEAILAIDEIQLIKQWPGVVKSLWDEDTKTDCNLKVVLSGSSSLLLKQGLTEGLTGRFELIPCYQWDFLEVKKAFDLTLDQYLFFGGYPGALAFVDNANRWLSYMENSIIAPSIFKDVISLDSITKPALMESVFTLGTAYSGQEVSWRKLLGQLDDAGNTTTIAHYVHLLNDAGLLAGLQKYSPKLLQSRGSSPRFIAYDTSLMTTNFGPQRDNLLSTPDLRGHLVECAIGAYLLRRAKKEHFSVTWWREGSSEVDFVLQSGTSLTALEVKSGRVKDTAGLLTFADKYHPTRTLIVGGTQKPTSESCDLESFFLGRIPLF